MKLTIAIAFALLLILAVGMIKNMIIKYRHDQVNKQLLDSTTGATRNNRVAYTRMPDGSIIKY